MEEDAKRRTQPRKGRVHARDGVQRGWGFGADLFLNVVVRERKRMTLSKFRAARQGPDIKKLARTVRFLLTELTSASHRTKGQNYITPSTRMYFDVCATYKNTSRICLPDMSPM